MEHVSHGGHDIQGIHSQSVMVKEDKRRNLTRRESQRELDLVCTLGKGNVTKELTSCSPSPMKKNLKEMG